jgi:p70 ribosomal S6 kinase
LEDFTILKVVGRGGFGKVYQVCFAHSISFPFRFHSLFPCTCGSAAFSSVELTLQVQSVKNSDVFALKVLRKDHLIKMNAVENTRAERDILRSVSARTNTARSAQACPVTDHVQVVHPFIVKLHFAFQTESKLYLGMDFING